MTLDNFIARLGTDDTVMFEETMEVIDSNYDFTPTAFTNGLGDAVVSNATDQNQGSCKIFAFGKLNGLDKASTLACFGQYYRDVLATPDGTDHANIRNFMRDGWNGIKINGIPLKGRQG